MSDRIRCRCRRCIIRSLMGPAVLITVGILFLLDQVGHGAVSFRYTWPIILVVMGAISLAASTSSAEGHVSDAPPAPTTPPPPPPAGPYRGAGS
jgi:hypothetical protein